MAEKQDMDQPQPRRRRRDGSSSSAQQHTKEKPYICHCGSAFSRRDLLTRHMRISHETNDGTSKSPDARVSDEGHQPLSEPATPNDHTPSRLDFSPDCGAPPSQYLESHHELVMADHAGSSYHQLSPRQDYYHPGHQYSAYDQYTGYPNISGAGGLQTNWNSYYSDQGTEQDMVDPILRGSMGSPTSPLHSEFPNHPYNSWMSASQHWGN
ncbi:hypothetical protein GGS21DRAFT_491551 [Xylaria nigripes]|nr:hypothetical protein GGS21DRAFT_491551 [Xylaria nigripes]